MPTKFNSLLLFLWLLSSIRGVGAIEPGPVIEGQAPAHQEWTVRPAGDAGVARMFVSETWSGNGETDALEFRYALLSTEPNPRKINDPILPFSRPVSCPKVRGAFNIEGLPEVPCAIQIRARTGETWTEWSLFKRLGEVYFGYDDEIVLTPGCVAETVPEIVYWGTGNLAKEGRQRVGDRVTTISGGDPQGHFEILKAEGKTYLLPGADAVSQWSGGEKYFLHLNDGSKVKVEILKDTTVIASGGNDFGGESLREYLAYFKRHDRENGLSGQMLLFRPGLYDTATVPDSGKFQNHFLLGNLAKKFTLRSADPKQPAVLTGMNIVAPHDQRTTIKWNFRFENLFFWQPEFLRGPSTVATVPMVRVLGGSSDSPAVEFFDNQFRTDGIEPRFGHHIRGGDLWRDENGQVGTRRVQITCLAISKTSGVHVKGNTFAYAYYAQFLTGISGWVEENLVTHIEADYVNLFAGEGVPQENAENIYFGNTRPFSATYRNNRHREHTGDQANVHSDGWHSWFDGTYEDCEVYGNIWNVGYEGMVVPVGMSASIANNLHSLNEDVTVGTPEWDHVMFSVNATAKEILIHLPDPASVKTKSGIKNRSIGSAYTFGVTKCDTSPHKVIITGQDFRMELKYPLQRIQIFAGEQGWEMRKGGPSFQGAPYQNNGNVLWRNFSFHHNLLFGLSTNSGALFAGMSAKNKPENYPASENIRVYNNGYFPVIPELPEDDRGGDGQLDSEDGVTGSSPKIRFSGGLSGLLNGQDSLAPRGISHFKNVVSLPPEGPHVRAWQDHYLGKPAEDSVAKRESVFSNQGGRNFRVPMSFAECVAQARLRDGTREAATYVGAVGPTDDAVGFYNFPDSILNASPPLSARECFPEIDSEAMPTDSDIVISFEYPIQLDTSKVILRNLVTGSRVDARVMSDGELLVVDPVDPLADGLRYELLVAGDALCHMDAPGNFFRGIGPGGFTFTVNKMAKPNILIPVPHKGSAEIQQALIRGEVLELDQAVRFDTLGFGGGEKSAPYMPRGEFTLMQEVLKTREPNQAGLSIQLFGEQREVGSLTLDTSTGQLKSVHPLLGEGSAGVIDMGDAWRIWIFGRGEGLSRYIVEVNHGGKTNSIRNPMMVDAKSPKAPVLQKRYLLSK